MKKILFVEDETSLQKAFGTILKDKGYDVISAFDGETGLKLAKEVKPSLILLDLILPKVHGFEVLKKLKEEKETKQIPVIVLTNLEDMENVGKALELGAMSYLVKAQYSLEEILEKIKKALGEI
jgi:DNA-binding response OmpR family regulator